MLDTVFMTVWDLSRTGSLVILAVLAARFLLKKAPRVFAYALWALVLVRLLCPVSLPSPVSLIPMFSPTAESYTLAGEDIGFFSAADAAADAVGDALNGGLGLQHIQTGQVSPTGNPETVTSLWWEVSVLFGKYLWLAGLAAMAVYSVYSFLRLRRQLVGATPLEKGVWLADSIPSPFVVGLLRPRIYLPSDLAQAERSYILQHERHHIRRGDHIIRLLAWLALCLHWFNPLVWLAFQLSGKDMEISCDEAVMRRTGTDIRADYAASLLRLSTGRRWIAAAPLAFGEGDVSARIRNLAKWKRPARWAVAGAAAAVLAAAALLLTHQLPRQTDLVGADYTLTQIVYTDAAGAEMEKPEHVSITGGLHLYFFNGYDQPELWLPVGKWSDSENMRTPFRYTNQSDSWLQHLTAGGSWDDYRPGSLEKAYVLPAENQYFYLALVMKNGDTLLGYGWQDASESSDLASDDSRLHWLARLENQWPDDNHIDGSFFSRSIAAVLGVNVSGFCSWETADHPDYHVSAFVADAEHTSQQEMRDMGLAVYKKSFGGYNLVGYQYYPLATQAQNGIFVCEAPVHLTEPDHPATDKNTYNAILRAAGPPIRAEYVIRDAKTGEVLKTWKAGTHGRYELLMFQWEDLQADRSTAQTLELHCYDENDTELAYGLPNVLYLQTQRGVAALESGTYTMAVNDTELLGPRLSLDVENGQFVFLYDWLSSYLNAGTFTTQGEYIVCTTNDGSRTFRFRAQAGSRVLQFAAEGSSPVEPISELMSAVPVTDGACFVWEPTL